MSGALFETQVDPNPKALSTQFSRFFARFYPSRLFLEFLRDSLPLCRESNDVLFNFSTKIGLRWSVEDEMEKCGTDLKDFTFHGRKFGRGEREGEKGKEEQFWLGENITMTSVHE